MPSRPAWDRRRVAQPSELVADLRFISKCVRPVSDPADCSKPSRPRGGGVLTFYPNGTIGGQTGWEYVYWMGQLLWQGSDGQWNSQWAESWMARLAGGGVAPWMHYGPDTGYKWAFSGRWGTDTMGFNVYPGRTYFLRSLIWWNSQPYAYPPAGGLDLEDIGSCTYNLSGASRASR